jgi:hypothetical protein
MGEAADEIEPLGRVGLRDRDSQSQSGVCGVARELAAERLWRERQDRPVGFRTGGAMNLDVLSKSGSFCQNYYRMRWW